MAHFTKLSIPQPIIEAVVNAQLSSSGLVTYRYDSTGWGSAFTAPSPNVPTSTLHLFFAAGYKHLYYQPTFSPGAGVAIKQIAFDINSGYSTQVDSPFTDTRFAVPNPSGTRIGAVTNPSSGQYFIKERAYDPSTGIGGTELSSLSLGTEIPISDNLSGTPSFGFSYIDDSHILISHYTSGSGSSKNAYVYELSGASWVLQCTLAFQSQHGAIRQTVSPFTQTNGKRLIGVVSALTVSPFTRRFDLFEWDDAATGTVSSSANITSSVESGPMYFLSKSRLILSGSLFSFDEAYSFASIVAGTASIPLHVDRGSKVLFYEDYRVRRYTDNVILAQDVLGLSSSDRSDIAFRNTQQNWRYVTGE